MPKKNRAVRLQDLKQGVTVYEVSYGGEIIHHLVMSRPKTAEYNTKYVNVLRTIDYLGNVGTYPDKLFLGDAGVPGFAYDERPNTLFLSRKAAIRAIPSRLEYENRPRETSFWDIFVGEYDDYDSYREEEEIRHRQERVVEMFREFGSVSRWIHEPVQSAVVNPEFRVNAGGALAYGSVIDGGRRVRMDFYVEPDGRIVDHSPVFLLRHGGNWYEVEADVWSKSNHKITDLPGISTDWNPLLNGRVEHLDKSPEQKQHDRELEALKAAI